MSDAVGQKQPELVTVTIDGKQLQVPKGTNIIEAAKCGGIDIPHYCYHPHLSVAGNCRMCQIQVKGQPKMTIACNTQAAEGMEVATHHTSKEVADAQAGTLEFILINHPLDCTVCDQAGHCKLQDYHFEYNARSSRFLEDKVHKVKAVALGPTVMLDGERCIMCTRCIRFCDEVTGTSEIGMLNRGDRSVIAVSPGRELSNPLSGNVVDLCPVGALTHRKWRFNTRIWFTKQTDSICPGCSTGCNVKVAERDGQVVLVKGRRNDAVNKEWLCDEGRYGFERFLPANRLTRASKRTAPGGDRAEIQPAEAINALKGVLKTVTVLVAPELLVEEYYLLKQLLLRSSSVGRAVLQYRERTLTQVEKILVSPDYAANFVGAKVVGLVGENPGDEYQDVLGKIRRKEIEHVVVLGDRAIAAEDIDAALLEGLRTAKTSVGLLADASSPLIDALGYVVPTRSILEKSGLLVNRNSRLQYTQAVTPIIDGTVPEWRFIGLLAEAAGIKLLPGVLGHMSDREVTRWYLSVDSAVSTAGITIAKVKDGGVQLVVGAKGYSAAATGDVGVAASPAA
jgi:NADH-quinone oxidoreductase subunit G